MAVNKVMYGNQTLIDLSTDTVSSSDDILLGKVGHLRDGSVVTGTGSGGGAVLSVNLSESGILPNVTLTPNKTYAQAKEVLDNGGALILSDGDGYNQFNYSYDYYGDEIDIYYNVLSADDYSYSCIFAWTSSGMTRLTELTLIPEPTESKIITQNGIHDVTFYATATVSVSGGASNFVTGTFTTPSTTATNGTVTVPYTGSGYPIALIVFVEGGCYNSAVSGWYNSMTRYAVGQYCITKANTTLAPTYGTGGAENQGTIQLLYKNNSSSATSYSSTRSISANSYSVVDATGTSYTSLRWRSNTLISYRTAGGTTSTYGLLADTTYRYIAVYSQ